MRTTFISLIALAAAFAGPAFAQDGAPENEEHPGEVALTYEDGVWLYRKFPSSQRLYVNEDDTPGVSTCNDTCAYAWPPLYVEKDGSEDVGDWSVFVREDGREQWQYKGKPAYMRFHDSLENPVGASIEGWDFLIP
jgi:predicted lipoprotein with Yx(FWY)xxD motif